MNFFTSFVLTISFCVTVFCSNANAYKNTGFERVNSVQTIKKANKLGLVITGEERRIKAELLNLKKKDKQAFKDKMADKLANPDFYQGYLMEVEEGLSKVENAKTIAKYVLYEKFEKNWNDLKLTAVNTIAEKDFKKYKNRLIKDLQTIVYVKNDQGYKFEVGQWAYVTVSNNLSGVTWRIEFASKNDNNELEPGAEDIKIDPSGGSSSEPSSDEGSTDF